MVFYFLILTKKKAIRLPPTFEIITFLKWSKPSGLINLLVKLLNSVLRQLRVINLFVSAYIIMKKKSQILVSYFYIILTIGYRLKCIPKNLATIKNLNIVLF